MARAYKRDLGRTTAPPRSSSCTRRERGVRGAIGAHRAGLVDALTRNAVLQRRIRVAAAAWRSARALRSAARQARVLRARRRAPRLRAAALTVRASMLPRPGKLHASSGSRSYQAKVAPPGVPALPSAPWLQTAFVRVGADETARGNAASVLATRLAAPGTSVKRSCAAECAPPAPCSTP